MSWKAIELWGAGCIDRVANIFEVTDRRLPSGRFKVKVLERANDYLAVPNVFVKDADGNPDYISGLGSSEEAAIADLFTRFMPMVSALAPDYREDAFDWADPRDF